MSRTSPNMASPPAEAEHVVLTGRRTYLTEGKWLARGQTAAGRYIQAIYLLESDVVEIDLVTLDDVGESFYVVHARPLTSAERSSLTRKRKGKVNANEKNEAQTLPGHDSRRVTRGHQRI